MPAFAGMEAQLEFEAQLAKAGVAMARRDGAAVEAAVAQALAMRPHDARALALMGRHRAMQGRHADAAAAFEAALQADPAQTSVALALGLILKVLGRGTDAVRWLAEAARLAPGDADALANLGAARMAQGDLAGALDAFERAEVSAPAVAAMRGEALQQLGRDDEAVAAFRRAVAAEPMDLTAHHALSQLLHHRRSPNYVASFDEAAARVANPTPLRLAKAVTLLTAEDWAAAEVAYAALPPRPETLYGLATARAQLGRAAEAVPLFEHALRSWPDAARVRYGLATALLRAGEPARAEAEAERLLARDPADQTALALLGLAWRLQGDPRAEPLHGFDTLVRTYALEPPEGFADMAAFNTALNAALDPLHRDGREFMDQSLKGGTQTHDDLFSSGHPLVERLKRRIEETVARYLAEIGTDATHPLLRRNAARFGFAGAWSSRLHDRGFHARHIHPGGWISSAYYVALPDVVADARRREGWLEFGAPPFALPLDAAVGREVKPEPGTLALFPSYLWHGTTPFASHEARTTVAFDVIPA